LNLSPEVRSQIILGGTGILIIAAFFLPIGFKYKISQFFGGKPIKRMCEEVIPKREIAIVMDYLNSGGDPNATTEDNSTSLLECALRYGDTEGISKQLIAKGLQVNSKNYRGETPLHLAVKNGDHAARSGNNKVAELLIAKGADVNAKDDEGNTPLFLAIMSGSTPLAKLLITQGKQANLNFQTKNSAGETILHIALRRRFIGDGIIDDTGVAELLIANCDVNAKDDRGNTPLHIVVSKNQSRLAKLLIAKGAQVNVKNYMGETLLHSAFQSSHKELVAFLIAKGVNINAADDQGNTPLYLAVTRGQREMAKFLIAKGANVNVINSQNETLLHYVAHQGWIELTELLISNGLKVNAKDISGNTALHKAVMSNKTGVTELLLQKGADVNVKNGLGQTPLYLARSSNQSASIVKILQDYNASQ
jgi:cytohesin